MEKYFEINEQGQNIRCKMYYGKSEEINSVILYGHGFAGHKDNNAAAHFAERILTKYKGISIITFDLPCHGNDVKKKLHMDDCYTYLELVLEYVTKQLHVESIYSYATSFGAYLVLNYIRDRGNPFEKLVLRCPAVNMLDIVTNTLMDEEAHLLVSKGKSVAIGFDRKIEINQQFIDELRNLDGEEESFLDFADDILIVHGTKDEIIPVDLVREFADNNVIECTVVENADHRFQNPACMEVATKEAIRWFEL